MLADKFKEAMTSNLRVAMDVYTSEYVDYFIKKAKMEASQQPTNRLRIQHYVNALRTAGVKEDVCRLIHRTYYTNGRKSRGAFRRLRGVRWRDAWPQVEVQATLHIWSQPLGAYAATELMREQNRTHHTE